LLVASITNLEQAADGPELTRRPSQSLALYKVVGILRPAPETASASGKALPVTPDQSARSGSHSSDHHTCSSPPAPSAVPRAGGHPLAGGWRDGLTTHNCNPPPSRGGRAAAGSRMGVIGESCRWMDESRCEVADRPSPSPDLQTVKPHPPRKSEWGLDRSFHVIAGRSAFATAGTPPSSGARSKHRARQDVRRHPFRPTALRGRPPARPPQ
jgi:hypothetical protein